MPGSIVQNWGAEVVASGASLATGLIPSSGTVTAGNFLLIFTNSAVNVTHTVTKNAGTATIGAVTTLETSTETGTGETARLHLCSVTGSGTLDLLVTYGSADLNRQIYALEISGTSAFFGSNSGQDSGTNPTPTLTVASVVAPSFAIAIGIDIQSGTFGVGTGYTNYAVLGGTVHFDRVQTKAVSSSGSVTANFVNTGLDRNNTFLAIFNEPEPPVISVQPEQQTVASGASATFSVTATGATSYQWQINTAGTWTNVSTGTGGTTSSYTTAALSTSDIGNLYRCQVTNAAGTTNTAEVFVFLTNQPSAGKGERGYHSAEDQRTTGRVGNIKANAVQFIRPMASRNPNKDNVDLVTTWFNWFFPAATSTTPTGTLTRTNANDTSSATALAVPNGTLSRTNANDTSAAQGTTTVVGSLARTNANDTSAASGTTVVSGSLARTNANDTSSASGNTWPNSTLARTNANDTLAASGSVGSAADGSVAYTNINDTLSAAGNTGILSTLARTNANDTLASSGSPIGGGTLARTNNNDTSAAAAISTVVGTSSTTNANDTLSASGSAGSVPIGTLTYTNNNDTVSSSGSTTILSSLAKTNNNDTLAASGSAGSGGSGVTTRLPLTGVGS